MSDLVPRTPAPGLAVTPGSFSEAMALAEWMAAARTVPQHLQNSPADCLLVIDQAMRWNMSPFAVAQKTSVVKGRLMFEGQLVSAVVETSGAIVGWMNYEFEGTGDARTVIASATRRGETEPRSVRVALKDARTANAFWNTQPDQQLCYHSARVWARRWTPSVMLGVYSPEEMQPEPARREPPHAGPTVEAAAEPIDLPELAPEPRRSVREILRDHLYVARSREDVVAARGIPAVAAVLATGPEDRRQVLQQMLTDAWARFPEPDSEDSEVTPEASNAN